LVASLAMVALWAMDPDRTVVMLGAVAWLVGLAFLAVAIHRTGLWAIRRFNSR
jgi:hypothetical protein